MATENSHEIRDDIYRGSPPPAETWNAPRTSSLFSSETSSSGSTLFGVRRLGAIGNVVEKAINRWAKGRWADSSSSSSSSTDSTDSRTTGGRSTYQNRQSSIGDLSEVDFHTRISIIKARQESRQVQRGFTLYLPPSLAISNSRPPLSREPDGSPHSRLLPTGQQITQTESLPEVLSQLDSALKRSSRTRRNLERRTAVAVDSDTPPVVVQPHHDPMLPDFIRVPSRPASFTDLKAGRSKGKRKEVVASTMHSTQAWFLDVASPSSADMHAIGKLLHLHPLTLEDILQQDPREKLEHFPKLGYYFISFRAVNNHSLRNKYRHDGDLLGSDFSVAEANVYLVVFKQGICSFHFTDISDHVDRVRSRMIQLEDVSKMSADWIAHFILDSIVDSLVILLQEIETDVMGFEDLVFSGEEAWNLESKDTSLRTQESATIIATSPDPEKTDNPGPVVIEKPVIRSVITQRKARAKFLLPTAPPIRRLKRFIQSLWRRKDAKNSEIPTTTTNRSLLRMARTRRLVTSLGRLLASKSEVMTQIRKRLLSERGIGTTDDVEVAMYMGQVRDHILTLQHSLAHYERLLSQSHPIYLSQLRTRVAMTKQGTDKAIIYLTVISVAVLCIQSLIGIFSLNVTIPHNTQSFNVFGIILALASLILFMYLWLVRTWWIQAKRRRAASLVT